jgi:cell division protein FtsB
MEFAHLKNVLQLFALLAASVLLIGSWRGENTFGDYFELKTSQQVLKKAVQHLEHDIARLENEITKINESTSYAEKVYRDKYHYTEADETIMFISD